MKINFGPTFLLDKEGKNRDHFFVHEVSTNTCFYFFEKIAKTWKMAWYYHRKKKKKGIVCGLLIIQKEKYSPRKKDILITEVINVISE
ncbi:LOW QUALITY PROTEIN: hypothetical protein TorRG33x02_191780 [Trema orientale]|uniref:Uncharacterized protein n=1 Tax=Trema orientale TaxID=63057 RepID=A0A2P5EHR7_TREOI|nr:LOW QUALITY PROTEIN: hypothetical protein TorRG33x02_191780 [Trema orientale]